MATTQFSPLFGDTYSSIDARQAMVYNIRRLSKRSGFRKNKALFSALLGAAAGGTATLTHKLIDEDSGPGGGVRTISTVTDINRATTATDVTNLKAMTSVVNFIPVPYPVDLSGNGGPAFTGS